MIAALGLSVALSVGASALTWGSTVALTTSRNGSAYSSLAGAGASTFHAVLDEANGGLLRVWYRRSTDGGKTWAGKIRLSSAGADIAYAEAVVARGNAIDAVWLEAIGDDSMIVYRRSGNGGTTWQPPIRISAAGTSPSYPRVARDSGNRVIVVWTDLVSKAIRVRRSLDGGATFGSPVSLGSTTNEPHGDGGLFDGFPAAAGGTGVLYVAFYASRTTLKARRSTDGGATWSSAITIATNGSGYYPEVTATASSAVVGYAVLTSSAIYPVVRRTTDKGATWKAPIALASNALPGFQPVVGYGGGAWRAAYERCMDTSCLTSAVYYRQSTDGTTWTSATRVSNSKRPYSTPAGIGFAGRVGVLYFDQRPEALDTDVFFRAGS